MPDRCAELFLWHGRQVSGGLPVSSMSRNNGHICCAPVFPSHGHGQGRLCRACMPVVLLCTNQLEQCCAGRARHRLRRARAATARWTWTRRTRSAASPRSPATRRSGQSRACSARAPGSAPPRAGCPGPAVPALFRGYRVSGQSPACSARAPGSAPPRAGCSRSYSSGQGVAQGLGLGCSAASACSPVAPHSSRGRA